jgi:hypothetical protein
MRKVEERNGHGKIKNTVPAISGETEENQGNLFQASLRSTRTRSVLKKDFSGKYFFFFHSKPLSQVRKGNKEKKRKRMTERRKRIRM